MRGTSFLREADAGVSLEELGLRHSILKPVAICSLPSLAALNLAAVGRANGGVLVTIGKERSQVIQITHYKKASYLDRI